MDRGKNFFRDTFGRTYDDTEWSYNFFHLLLEMIKKWGNEKAFNEKGGLPTPFRALYSDLDSHRIFFPVSPKFTSFNADIRPTKISNLMPVSSNQLNSQAPKTPQAPLDSSDFDILIPEKWPSPRVEQRPNFAHFRKYIDEFQDSRELFISCALEAQNGEGMRDIADVYTNAFNIVKQDPQRDQFLRDNHQETFSMQEELKRELSLFKAIIHRGWGKYILDNNYMAFIDELKTAYKTYLNKTLVYNPAKHPQIEYKPTPLPQVSTEKKMVFRDEKDERESIKNAMNIDKLHGAMNTSYQKILKDRELFLQKKMRDEIQHKKIEDDRNQAENMKKISREREIKERQLKLEQLKNQIKSTFIGDFSKRKELAEIHREIISRDIDSHSQKIKHDLISPRVNSIRQRNDLLEKEIVSTSKRNNELAYQISTVDSIVEAKRRERDRIMSILQQKQEQLRKLKTIEVSEILIGGALKQDNSGSEKILELKDKEAKRYREKFQKLQHDYSLAMMEFDSRSRPRSRTPERGRHANSSKYNSNNTSSSKFLDTLNKSIDGLLNK